MNSWSAISLGELRPVLPVRLRSAHRPGAGALRTVRDSPAKQSTPGAKLATIDLTVLLNPAHWNADGSLRDPALAFTMLRIASTP